MNKRTILKPLLITAAVAAAAGLAQAGTAPWHTDASNYDEQTRTLSSETSSYDAPKTREQVIAELHAYQDANLIQAMDLENTLTQVEFEQRLAQVNDRFEAERLALAAAEEQRALIALSY